jgi:ubiquitin carboxyl-terminal hydrolase 36/42
MEAALLQQAGWPQPPPKGAPRLDARSRETTLLHHVYGGYVRRQTLCDSCGHASRTFEHCLGLMIEMPGGVGSVEGALDAFFRDEWLDEENQYKWAASWGL